MDRFVIIYQKEGNGKTLHSTVMMGDGFSQVLKRVSDSYPLITPIQIGYLEDAPAGLPLMKVIPGSWMIDYAR